MVLRRLAVPLLFLLATLGFLLPCIGIEKAGVILFKLRGAALITSETFYTTGVPEPREVPADPWLLSAAVLGMVGMVAGFAARRAWPRRISAVAGTGAFLALGLFPATTASRIAAALPQMFTLHLERGYWISLACYGLSAMAGWFASAQRDATQG